MPAPINIPPHVHAATDIDPRNLNILLQTFATTQGINRSMGAIVIDDLSSGTEQTVYLAYDFLIHAAIFVKTGATGSGSTTNTLRVDTSGGTVIAAVTTSSVTVGTVTVANFTTVMRATTVNTIWQGQTDATARGYWLLLGFGSPTDMAG